MLRMRNLDTRTAAAMVGLPKFKLAEVLHGDRDITPPLAVLFATLTHTTPDMWMSMQQEFDEAGGRRQRG